MLFLKKYTFYTNDWEIIHSYLHQKRREKISSNSLNFILIYKALCLHYLKKLFLLFRLRTTIAKHQQSYILFFFQHISRDIFFMDSVLDIVLVNKKLLNRLLLLVSIIITFEKKSISRYMLSM